MRILKVLAGVIGGLLVLIVALIIGARFGDGPIAIIPGGPLEAGELVSGPEPDWTFARDIPEMEFQLVDPPVSRTIWLQVHDKKLYVVSGYMNSTVGKLWKKWPAQALQDGRAVIRIGGKRYELLQFHFHSPSEHNVAGRQAAMEVHFVHQSADGELAVVGAMIEVGEENMALREPWANMPNQGSW